VPSEREKLQRSGRKPQRHPASAVGAARKRGSLRIAGLAAIAALVPILGLSAERDILFSATARGPQGRPSLPFSAVAGFGSGQVGFAALASSLPVAYSAIARPWQITLSGKLSTQLAINSGSGRANQADLTAEPKITLSLPSGLKLTTSILARVDTFDTIEKGKPSNRELSRFSRPAQLGTRANLEIREAFLETTLAGADIKLGRQQTKWGNAMGLKVLDVVNPVDFREFILAEFDDSRIPLYSLNVSIPFSETTRLNTVWVLDQTYSDLPPPGSTFEFTSPFVLGRMPPVPFPVEVRSVDRPKRVLRDSDVGFELETSLLGTDITLNYLYHYDDFPIPFVTPPNGPNGSLIVDLEFQRTHLIGASATRFFGPLRLRTELGYSSDKYLPNIDPFDSDKVSRFGEFSYVAGADFLGFKDTIISFQFFQSIINAQDRFLERDRRETNLTLFVQRPVFTKNLSLRTIVLHSINRADGIFRPRFTYALGGGREVYLGADLFYGTKRGFFGQFKEQDQIVLGFSTRL